MHVAVASLPIMREFSCLGRLGYLTAIPNKKYELEPDEGEAAASDRLAYGKCVCVFNTRVFKSAGEQCEQRTEETQSISEH